MIKRLLASVREFKADSIKDITCQRTVDTF